MKTLYVSDLDGTLLNSHSKVSNGTALMLNRVIEAGGLFSVATARTPATATGLLTDVHVSLPMLTLSGAGWWDNINRRYTHVEAIPPEVVCAVADVMERHGVNPFVYRRHGSLLHTHHHGEMSEVERRFVAERQGLPLKRFFLDEDDIRHNPDEAILMFSHRGYEQLRPVVEELRRDIPCQVMFYHDIVDPDIGLLEVYAAGCTKADAVLRLAAEVGAERVITFGDNRNDIPMLRAATHSVAMGNAFPEVKAVASEVTGTNDEDAVARWIERDFFGEQ
ncbi:MAG: HAD hydrolase family protein [Muribaculaceae bacterium]|nr:HAD hydrolase family protein [Muribaculaceae bacterium]